MNHSVRSGRHGRTGQTVLIMLLALPTLLGALALGVDVGMMYFNWEELQKAADAAALAGASVLPGDPAGALANASQYALSNGVQQSEIVSNEVAGDDLSITVSLQRTVPYYFAQVLGLLNQQLTVAATAGVQQNPDNASGLIPVGLSCSAAEGQSGCSYQQGTMYQLKGSQVGPGNWAPIELGGTPGANAYRNYMEIGYTGDVPQQVPTETGNIVGPTGQAIASRISKGMAINPTATYSNPPSYDPRLVVVPLIQFNDPNGKTPVTVVGYALGWLAGTTGNNNTINLYFLNWVSQPSSTSSPPSFGLNTPILIR